MPTIETRTSLDHLIDLTDHELLELFQANGIITDPADTLYTRNAILNVARTAYWIGLTANARDPKAATHLETHLAEVQATQP